MPLTIPAGEGTAAVRMRYGADPEEMVCTFGIRAGGSVLNTASAERILAAWIARIRPLQDDSIGIVGVTIRVRDDGGGDFVYDAAPAAASVGGTVGAGLPSNCAILARKFTGRAGRRGRGRMFIPGINEGAIDEVGLLTPAGITAWDGALANFLADLGAAATAGPPATAPVIMTVQHNNTTSSTRNSGGGVTTVTTTQGAAGPLPDVVTQLRVDGRIGTQRRRLRP